MKFETAQTVQLGKTHKLKPYTQQVILNRTDFGRKQWTLININYAQKDSTFYKMTLAHAINMQNKFSCQIYEEKHTDSCIACTASS